MLTLNNCLNTISTRWTWTSNSYQGELQSTGLGMGFTNEFIQRVALLKDDSTDNQSRHAQYNDGVFPGEVLIKLCTL